MSVCFGFVVVSDVNMYFLYNTLIISLFTENIIRKILTFPELLSSLVKKMTMYMPARYFRCVKVDKAAVGLLFLYRYRTRFLGESYSLSFRSSRRLEHPVVLWWSRASQN